jgi:hypothetical protein
MFAKKIGAAFALSSALAIAVTQRAQASTITVVPSEVQSQIQASINNSHVGDTIAFQAGNTICHSSDCSPDAATSARPTDRQSFMEAAAMLSWFSTGQA